MSCHAAIATPRLLTRQLVSADVLQTSHFTAALARLFQTAPPRQLITKETAHAQLVKLYAEHVLRFQVGVTTQLIPQF